MIYLRLYCTIFFVSCTSLLLNGQFSYFTTDLQNHRFLPQSLGNASPEVATFAKYGNVDINHYNGLLNFQIPIYEYKDRDFQIPINLKYISSIFKPNQRSSLVGQNWSMGVGGVITRSVRGTPDDVKGNKNDKDYHFSLTGLLAAVRDPSIRKYNKNELENYSDHYNGTSRGSYDLEPDIFNFTFGDYSGSFVIDHTGNPISIDAQGCKIDISELSIQEYSLKDAPTASTIRIISPDGYIYEFGGDINYLEWIIPGYPLNDLALKINPRHITAWLLKKIIAPNRRNVEFTYEPHTMRNNYSFYISQTVYTSGSTTANYEYTLKGVANKDSEYRTHPHIMSRKTDEQTLHFKDKISTPILNKILINNTSISFEKESQLSTFYGENNGADDIMCITSIEVTNSSKQNVHKTSFNYKKNGKYILLNDINTQGQKYFFSYNSMPTEADTPNTENTDHWGGWTGQKGTENKSVNTSVCKTGLLSKIQYPTGGETRIDYDYNRYNYISSNYISEAKASGGGRVRSLKDYDPITKKEFNIRTFEYKYPISGYGSGSIKEEIKYRTEEEVQVQLREIIEGSTTSFSPEDNSRISVRIDCNTFKNISILSYSKMNISKQTSLDEYHIGYSNIIESFEDGSYIHYKYSSHQDVPDNENGYYLVRTDFDIFPFVNTNDRGSYLAEITRLYQFSYQKRQSYPPITLRFSHQKELADKYGLLRQNDKSRFRGKLLEKTLYSSNKKVIQKEEFFYNTENSTDKYEFTISQNKMGYVSNKIFTSPYLLTKKRVTDENNVVITEYFSYNPKGFISKMEVTNSDAIPHSYTFRYPSDETSSTDQNIKDLNSRNIIKNPILVSKTTGIYHDITDAVKTDFIKQYDMLLKHTIYDLETYEPIKGNSIDSHFISREIYQHDSYGNPTEIIKDGIPTVYLWSYNGQHLIAEIKDTSYDEVKKALEGITPEELLKQLVPDMPKINALRSKLKGKLVTTYTYKPLVGVLTITDSRGETTYYEYDELNRLKKVYLKEGNKEVIIDQYKYSYRK